MHAGFGVAATLGSASVATAQPLRAQTASATPAAPAQPTFHRAPPLPPFWATEGRWNLGLQIGFALQNNIPRNISHINLLIAQPEVAFVAGSFARSPVRRFDIVNQGIVGNAIHPGGRLTGYALLFRLHGKNYGRLVPFFDFGVGLQNTRLYLKAPELNGPTQFTPQGGPGFEYYFRPQRALVVQYRYLHMSNAGLELPNLGFNANMLSVGFRWLRRPHPGR